MPPAFKHQASVSGAEGIADIFTSIIRAVTFLLKRAWMVPWNEKLSSRLVLELSNMSTAIAAALA